jgi:PAS domain S-box-containing protein
MARKPTYQDLERMIDALKLEKDLLEDRHQELAQEKERYERIVNTIPCAVYDYVRWPDGRSKFIYMSAQAEKIFTCNVQEIMEQPDILWNMVHPEDFDRLDKEDFEATVAGKIFQSELRVVLPSGQVKWIQITSMASSQKYDSQIIWSGVALDISERKEVEAERNRLVLDLQNALAEVKTLKGIIPICCYCKKIRDDKGFWTQVEEYISAHSDADLSHGICPECAKKYFPDYDLYPIKSASKNPASKNQGPAKKTVEP